MTNQNKTLQIFFGAVIVFLILLSVFTYKRLTALIDLGQLVNHNTQLTLQLEKTMGILKDGETSYRDYLLTRDNRFLEPFNLALQEYPQHLSRIKGMIGNNQIHHQQLSQIESLISTHYGIQLKKLETPQIDTAIVDKLNVSKKTMDSLLTLVDEMIEGENSQMEERSLQLQKNTFMAPAMILLLSFLAFMILVVSYFQLSKSLRHTQYLQEAIIKQNVQLEKKQELQNIFNQAPVPIAVFRGSEFAVEVINNVALRLLSKSHEEVIDKPLFEIAPNLKELIQPIFDQVLQSGEAFIGSEFPIQFDQNGQPYNGYFDLVFQPALDEKGNRSGLIAIGQNITESVVARKQIQLSEERYRELSMSLEEKVLARTSELKKEKDFSETIIDTTLDLIVVYDKETRIIVFNKACEDFFKLRKEDILGKTFAEVFPMGRDTSGEKDLHNALRGATIHNKVYYSPITRRYYENFITPLKDDQDEIYAALVIAHDISDAVESTEKINKVNTQLLERNQFVETLINSSPDLIVVIDRDFKCITLNKKAELDFNTFYSGNVIGKKCIDIYPKLESDRIYAEVNKAFEGITVIGDKVRSTISDQYYKHNYIPLKNLNQEVYAVMIISHEITSQVHNELALKESEEKFNKLFQFSPFSIALSEILSGKYVDVNENYTKTFEYTREEIIGKTYADLNIIDQAARQEIIKKTSDTGSVRNIETELRKKTGEKIPALLSVDIISIGEKKYYLHAVIDIIERKKAEFKIAQKNSELEKKNKELQSFAYISSHDLQEPLRKIQTFATRILDKEHDSLSENAKDNFKRMQIAAQRMQTLIEDLLAYSRTSTEPQKMEYMDLRHLIEEVKEDIKEDLKNKQAVIELKDSVIIGIIPFQFRQMMHNLIGNSLKFSKPAVPPHILIDSEIRTGEALKNKNLLNDQSYYHIRITDNGIGFEPEYSEKIFEVFQRLHDKDTYPGTGVGLAIVKKIVENHNGFITTTGVPHQSAQFDIYFPVI